jgi:hypothetical protein
MNANTDRDFDGTGHFMARGVRDSSSRLIWLWVWEDEGSQLQTRVSTYGVVWRDYLNIVHCMGTAR